MDEGKRSKQATHREEEEGVRWKEQKLVIPLNSSSPLTSAFLCPKSHRDDFLLFPLNSSLLSDSCGCTRRGAHPVWPALRVP